MARRTRPSKQQSSLFPTPRWLEEEFAQQNIERIIGVDEAGRGPLAGPVVAAAVQLPPGTFLAELDDSKRLSESQRERLFHEVREVAIATGVGVVSASEIDDLNILQATFKAMQLALGQLRRQQKEEPQRILIDGNRKFDYDLPLQTVVQGDHLSHNIAAASILAKVTRDRLMVAYHGLYPLYDFASHKGYPSPQHRSAIREHGPCPIHRFTFRGVLLSDESKTHKEVQEELPSEEGCKDERQTQDET